MYRDVVKSPANRSSILFYDGKGTMHLPGSLRNNTSTEKQSRNH